MLVSVVMSWESVGFRGVAGRGCKPLAWRWSWSRVVVVAWRGGSVSRSVMIWCCLGWRSRVVCNCEEIVIFIIWCGYEGSPLSGTWHLRVMMKAQYSTHGGISAKGMKELQLIPFSRLLCLPFSHVFLKHFSSANAAMRCNVIFPPGTGIVPAETRWSSPNSDLPLVAVPFCVL